jgi:hypothetical protein
MDFSFSDTLLHDLLYFSSCRKSHDVIMLGLHRVGVVLLALFNLDLSIPRSTETLDWIHWTFLSRLGDSAIFI